MCLLLGCVAPRTELVLVVETDATQGALGAPVAAGEYPRLIGLRSEVFWGPRPAPTAVVPGRAFYEIEVERGAPLRAARQRVELPFPVFVIETKLPEAFRWVRFEVSAVVRDGNGRVDRRVGPFWVEVPFVEGETRQQRLLLERACLLEPPARGDCFRVVGGADAGVKTDA